MCQNLAEIHSAFKVEVDKKEVYDATDKLKSLLDAEKESKVLVGKIHAKF